MKLKLTWLMTLFMAFVMQFSYAQEKTVTGTVTSVGDGLPLPGVSVVVKGTARGVQTDFDGKYSITVSPREVLVFTSLGFRTAEVTVGASGTYNFAMQEDISELDEVVIVGYGGTTSKAKSIASTVKVASGTIENRPNVNVLNTLQGQVAGVNISSFSGQPGTNKNDVIIRGVGTLSASSDPLYVIDGVPLTQAFFRNLNPNEIADVTVLKDAAATSVYGNRGSNGVIVITTKKGEFNKSFSVSYSGSYGVTEFRGDDYNLPSAIQHLRLQRKGFDEGVAALGGSLAVTGSYLGGAVTVDPNNLEAYNVNTDWQDVFFREGRTASHDINFTSGGENFSNFTSVGYFEQDGIVPTTNFKRFTVRSNFSGKSANGKFNYGVNIFGAFSRRNQLEQETRAGINNNVLQNPLTGYLNSNSFLDPNLYVSGQQLFDDFGNPALNLTPFMLLDLYGKNNAPSFFDEIKTITTLNASYKITDDLTFSMTSGIDYSDDKRVFAIGPESYLSIVRASGAAQPFHGLENQSSTRELMFNHVNRLNYNKVFADKHSFDISLYTEYVKAHRRTTAQQHIGLNPLTWSPGAGTGYITYNPASMPVAYAPFAGAAKVDAGLFSYFGTAEYDYDGKYGFSASLRRDASYRFIDDNKWGTFWSVGGRWNITKEDFVGSSAFLNDLKLRASYGTTGNQNVIGRGVDSNSSTIFLGSQLVRDLNSSQAGYNNAASFGVASYANRDLVWETTTQTNIGLDFGLMNNRLTGSVDIYRRLTEDLYQNLPISASNGITNLASNDGSLVNKGIEFEARYRVFREGDFKLSVFGNIAYNESRFDKLGSVDDDGDGSYRPSDDFIRNEGGLISEYFQVPYAGVNPANGNLLFIDIDGNLTENPTDSDRRATGKSPLPKYQGGFGFDIDYKGFFLNTLFTYSVGAYKFDTDYNGLMDIRNAGEFPVSTDLFNAWTPTNTRTDIPALAATNLDSQNISDRFLRDASYLRLRNVTVGYSVPEKFLDKTLFTSLRMRVIAENFFTWTNWRGFDPESFVASQTGYYPTPRIITFGIDANF